MIDAKSTAEPLYSSLGADPDLAEIVGLFVDEMPARVSALQDLLQAADWESLRRTAHQLKGAAGSYGFGPISPAAAVLETALRENAPEDEIRKSVDELVDLCSRARGGAPE